MSDENQVVDLKSVPLSWETCIKVMIHFVQKAQTKAAYKLQTAGVLLKAVNFFTTGQEPDMNEIRALRVLVNGVHIGQSVGAYSLEEAGLMQNRFIPYLETELAKRAEKAETDSKPNKESLSQTPVNQQVVTEL